MKRLFIALLLIPLLFTSCGKDNPTDDPQNVYLEEYKMDSRALKAIKESGNDISGIKFIYYSHAGEVEIDAKGNGIHYIQSAGVKDNTAYIFITSFVVEGQQSKLNGFDDSAIEKFDFVKRYTFPISKKTLVVDHGYGEKETLEYIVTAFRNFMRDGNNFYGILFDYFGPAGYDGGNASHTDNFQLMIDRNNAVKTYAYELAPGEESAGGRKDYDYGLWKGYGNTIICGGYCYSLDGE